MLFENIQTICNIIWCCWSSSMTYWQRIWLQLFDWTRSKFLLAWSCDWDLFCLYVKLFVPSNFNSVDFWSSMTCIVRLDIELTDRNIIKELGVFINGKFQGYSFGHPRRYKTTKLTFLVLGLCSIHSCKFCIVSCFVVIYPICFFFQVIQSFSNFQFEKLGSWNRWML